MSENLLPLNGGASKIIKRKNQKMLSVAFGSLVKHQILSAEENARAILRRAVEKSENLIAAAETEAGNIRAEAYRAGREEAENELLGDLLAIKEERAQILSTVESEILRLSVKLAEKIIGREVRHDESARVEIVLNALRQARQQEMLTVRVSANDLPLLEQIREKIDRAGRAQYVDFVADQAVLQGGCIIESQSGTIDARLETQLRILESALLARVSND